MTATAEPLAVFRQALANAASDAEAAAIAATIRQHVRRLKASEWEPYPWQHPHEHPPGWVSERAPGVCDERCHQLPAIRIPAQGTWLEYGGRGTGKTEGAAHYVNDHVENGPACDHRLRGGHKLLIVGPTQGDAIDACVTGVSGLETINPAVRHVTRLGGTFVIWPNGARARIIGASSPEDVKSLRASGNNCLIWLEEAAAMRRLEQVRTIGVFGLRTGPHAHWVMSTTPANRAEMQAISADPATIVTRGRTRDAHKLNPEDREFWENKYGGTTIGRQELDAEELGDVEGALWVTNRPLVLENGEANPDHRPGIANDRILDPGLVGWVAHPRPQLRADVDGLPPLLAVSPVGAAIMLEETIVSVDPAGGSTENGITVLGRRGQEGYVLADLSLKGPPDTWARVVLAAVYDYGCTGVAIETTYGGDQVPAVIRLLCQSLGIPVPAIFRMPTKVGKKLRAEPIVALYQQHRMHHVGVFPLLEKEQTTWVEAETPESPNRIDALVHGGTYLLVAGGQAEVSNPARLGQQLGSISRPGGRR